MSKSRPARASTLFEKRQQLDLTQNELSVKLGVSLTTIAKLENAPNLAGLATVRFGLLLHTAKALGMSLAQLVPALTKE